MLQAAIALLVAAGLWSWLSASLPASLALSLIGSLLAAGVLNVGIAPVQVFWPGVIDGDWIAHSGFPGRAVGNLRQPNHLSSLLLWSCIATVVLLQLGRLSASRGPRRRSWVDHPSITPTPAATAAARSSSSCVATGNCRRNANSKYAAS